MPPNQKLLIVDHRIGVSLKDFNYGNCGGLIQLTVWDGLELTFIVVEVKPLPLGRKTLLG